jgi:molecular chaperone DnaK (HSP70)
MTFLIGIDLGTTNCTLSYTKQEEGPSPIEQFFIPQVTKSGVQEDVASLPSFIYFPLEEELKVKTTGISWEPARSHCVGLFAQNRGAELPSRLIASAKSWLCHSGIDRREASLPLMAEDDIQKSSPLHACAQLLKHLKEAWDNKMDAPFVEQNLFITVPASFDPSARQLVQEAAQHAGYPEAILLEEPQAAFYAWMHAHAEDWRSHLKVGDCILVIDIGGGTTDFSLIEVCDAEGDLALNRVAVGAHLLLGGDNIDLAFAHLAKNKLEEQGHAIDDWQLQSLVHSCRKAKETLMGEKPPKHVDITVLGRGSKLIGGSLKTKITLEDAKNLMIEGFAPLVEPTERSKDEKRSGMQQLGLPYAQDPRLTCQLARFLSMSGEFIMPTVVLFNGGTTKAAALQDRFVAQLDQWAKSLDKPPVRVLPNPDYDFAVSRGAVNYGLARAGKAIRIRSGTSNSYFIGVEDAVPAIPGMATPIKALCIAPFGMEEGTELELNTQEFALVVGEKATFRFFSRAAPKLSDGTEPAIGTVVRQWKSELTELHPIDTRLDNVEGDGKTIRVKIGSRVTELGMLELWCQAADGRKWKLEFDVRKDK